MRLYLPTLTGAQDVVELTGDPFHYLKTVMRCKPGQTLKLFNGREDELQATIQELGKRSGLLKIEGVSQPFQESSLAHVTLFFPPLKPHRQGFLVEKATELGVGCLQPVITEHTQIRKVNLEKLTRQSVEAAEQSGRLTIPEVREILPLKEIFTLPFEQLFYGDLQAGHPLQSSHSPFQTGVLIGPEGGLSEREHAWLATQNKAQGIDLGTETLRAETAALMLLSLLKR